MKNVYNKQKYLQISKSKGISLDMFLFNKYNNYKLKYLESKNNMIGGKYKVGEKDSTELLNANLTLVQAHGSINISEWYGLPENVYLMITSDIGGITCSNYNKIFQKLINDTNSRNNLKSILESISKISITGPENKIIRTIYEGGNIMYEPGDLIPRINLGFHHSSMSGTTKSIYGIFNFDSIKKGDNTRNNILNDYDELLNIDSKVYIERTSDFSICSKFNKDKLIHIIQTLKKREIKINFDMAFTEFLVKDTYKKYIAQPENLDFSEVRDDDDNIFLTMILTLMYRTDIDINTFSQSIKDIVDKLDKSKPNLIVLTSCLHTKNVLMRIFNKTPDIPNTLIQYNENVGYSEKAGEYIKNRHQFPQYKITDEEIKQTERFLEIYNDWANNNNDITYILEEEITSNHLKNINKIQDILVDCVLKNNYNVIKQLRINIDIDDNELKGVIEKIVKIPDVKTNKALIELFKFKIFSDPKFKVDKKSLYIIFETFDKKSLWDALIINKIECYEINYNTIRPIIDKLMLKSSDDFTFKNEQERIKLVELYSNNSTFNLLEYILEHSWGIDSYIIMNLKQLEYIIKSNIDKNKIKELILRIYKIYNLDETLKNLLMVILDSNKLFNFINPNEVSDLLIDIIKEDYTIDIDKLNYLVEILKKNKININLPNQIGYNLYSYIVEKHKCRMAITKFNATIDYEFDKTRKGRIQEQLEQGTADIKYQEIIQKIEALGFINNGHIIKDLPSDFTGVSWSYEVDNIKCSSYYE